MTATELRVLASVVERARVELREMSEDELPSRLRKVARSSARVLPAPFAQSILSEIRRNDTFRKAVASRWEDDGVDDPVGLAFLLDPDGSQDLVARADLEREVSELESKAHEDALRIVSLEEKMREAKRRLKRERDAHIALIDGLGAQDEDKRESLVRSKKVADAARSDVETQLERAEEMILSLRLDLSGAEKRLQRSAERAKRRDMSMDEVRGARQLAPPSDPVAFAMWLDTVERVQRPYRDPQLLEALTGETDPLAIPVGVAPDGREAVTALVAQHPRMIVIDGYNVAGLLSSLPLASASNRASVVSKAERLASVSGSSVIVVFDAEGSDAEDEEARVLFVSPGGVEVRFAVTESADDQIVDLVRSDPRRSVVVTNDRELRERCLIDGCVPVWSSAFLDWSIH